MTNSRWRRIEALFLDAVDLSPAARETYLRDACGGDVDLHHEISDLLRAEQAADSAISNTVTSVAQDFADRITWSRIGERVGAYRLIDVLGQGGMGTVYLAERADDAYRGQVAIKFVRGSYAAPDLARRFISERQILADLNHSGIARLLDGGQTIDGTPYLVLEFVEGVPIDSWCETRALGLPERVDLMLAVCEAVQFAHDARVVHRDLKPSNILVTASGAPKLVDFGIAKLLSDPGGHQTVTALQVLTPAYASPEQVRGEPVTYASDVYSLGVVIYQLLTGRLPFDLTNASAGEVERRISQEVPPPLSRSALEHDAAWRRTLTGDLDAIVAKALEKRVEARYASVAALATELRAWRLAPVGGRRWRRLVRAVRRHRVRAVAGALVAIAATATGVRAVAANRDAAIAFRLLPSQAADPGLPSPFRVVAADVNGDGREDLIWNHLADSTNQFAIGLGQLDGTFVMQAVVTHPARPEEGWLRSARLLTGDIDGDGREDVLWSRLGESLLNLVFVAFSTADGTFRFAEPFRFGHPTLRWGTGWAALVGDLDADGRDDLVFNLLREVNAVRAFRSVGDGTFASIVEFDHFAKRWDGYQAYVADVDGDGRADLLWNDVPALANRMYVARSRGDRLDLLSQQDHPVTAGWSGFEANAADITGDRRSDIVWTRIGRDTLEIHVAPGQSSALFQYLPLRRLAMPATIGQRSPVTGDFNGDDRLDFVWGGLRIGSVIALRATRSGNLTLEMTGGSAATDVAVDTAAVELIPLDVNADGRDDLVWLDHRTRRVHVAIAVSPRS